LKTISLLGATGSIGTQTLDIIREHPSEFTLAAFSVGKNIDLARKMIVEFQPELVSVQDYHDCNTLKAEFPNIKFTFGQEGLIETAARTRTRYKWSSARRICLTPGDNESRDRKILPRPYRDPTLAP
jgi:1-deoxy-D-xylulose 5-phosphate reductoisomerase